MKEVSSVIALRTKGGPPRPDARSIVLRSGLFDAQWYREANGGVVTAADDALAHFLTIGWREGLSPNPYFDTPWYLRQNGDVARLGLDPLTHYITRGEAAGAPPSSYFDPLWYRTRHDIPRGDTALRHFLERRRDGSVSPVPEFDVAHYLASYPDIAAAGCDPFEHYLLWGFREGRNPSATFDTRFYVGRYLDGSFERNPLLHFRQFRHIVLLHTQAPPQERAVFDEVRRFTRAGPHFERFAPLPRTAARRAKLLAYYLPQFHPIPENDVWWGDGFTEWNSVARGQPRFAGHYQPRTPRDLGHYSLDDPATLRRQIEMARDAGLFGFVMYFYWFNGKRLLERPVEQFLADPKLAMPFCLMWANENWTRRWDGSEHEVLISQDYRESDDAALIDCFARHMRDPRYIRVDGRPLLMIYRPRLIPATAATVQRWRALFADRHGETPLLIMAQSFTASDPRPLGFDAAIEFPPHKLVEGLSPMASELAPFDMAARPQVFAYEEAVEASLAETPPAWPLIKTAAPSWDNDARREGAGLVLHGSTPAAYQRWLSALIDRARERPWLGESFVCINAWNEWAEGAYLEPDAHFGAAYLNATSRAVARPAAAEDAGKLLLIGHDAYPAGSQQLLLHLGRILRARFGVAVEFLLLAGGAMLAEYQAAAPTTVATVRDGETAAAHLASLVGRGYRHAIANTAASGVAVSLAREAGARVTLLVHELPVLLASHQLMEAAEWGANAAETIVFATQSIADAFARVVRVQADRMRILPQGCYRTIARDPDARRELRRQLGLDDATSLVIGAGTGDLRKGFDLFLQAWRCASRHYASMTFCWLGEIDPGLRAWLAPEIAAAEATGTFRAPGRQADPSAWFSAADAFALTSREDPFPTVVLEALSAELPVACFADSGGAPELLRRLGVDGIVPLGDAAAMADTLRRFCKQPATPARAALSARVRAESDFGDYADRLLTLALPELPRISVAVTSCDYARYLQGRLASVFAQTVPLVEVAVFDDASTDASVAVARATAADWRREIAIVAAERRSGSPFGHWREAASRSRAEWLWIAESDDDADPTMLARLAGAAAARPDTTLAACDSRTIDAEGAPLWPSYQAYYAESGAPDLARSFHMPARDFARRFLSVRNLLLNASAVLWRRSALLAALDRCGNELATFRLAGDWRLYLEALAVEEGSVAWVAEPLNVHRRHEGGVTARLERRRHHAEIERMHRIAQHRLGLDSSTVERQRTYLQQLEM